MLKNPSPAKECAHQLSKRLVQLLDPSVDVTETDAREILVVLNLLLLAITGKRLQQPGHGTPEDARSLSLRLQE